MLFEADLLKVRLHDDLVNAFGDELIDHGLQPSSVARAFLEVTPNSEMLGVFWMPEPRRLYGRQTEMHLRGTKLGDIIEVLAPV